ncbi:hypothetical protein QBC37DRAFT_170599 [Rhypophila decipiens]|uniref:Tetraspanin n=1 Tax=Rhypophila decipiens TaxID=261697 RepID=A0AAN6Y927_9PEZI|nr:hypothetical protein QBC37DRAFT_170599 [Rhypophila decipiens]
MAGWLILLYLLVIAGLFGVAIYEHTTASSLFLPVSSTLTVLTILLPVLSLFNTIYHHQSSSPSSSSAQSSPPLSLPPPGNGSSSSSSLTTTKQSTKPAAKITLPGTLQFTQAALTIFLLATFLSLSSTPSGSGSGEVMECLLSSKWKSLWTSHNADAIRKIQDQLVCCGFRSVKDMAWPFPSGNPEGDGKKHVDCVARYGRHEPCLKGWEGELSSLVGGEIGVLVFTGLVQFVGWYFAGRVGNKSGGVGETLKGIWRSVLTKGERRDGGREWDDDESGMGTGTGRRSTNGAHGGGRSGGRGGSRLLVSGGEVGRLVEVDDDEESTGERDIDRDDVESGHAGYGTTGPQGNVWRSQVG